MQIQENLTRLSSRAVKKGRSIIKRNKAFCYVHRVTSQTEQFSRILRSKNSNRVAMIVPTRSVGTLNGVIVGIEAYKCRDRAVERCGGSIQDVRDMNKNNQSQHNGGLSSLATCVSCIYMIRHKETCDVIVCVSYLRVMPTNKLSVCNLYAPSKSHTELA